MKEDLRVCKTKLAIKKALKELLSEKSFEKITVLELCDRALINRVTFYTHYKDKYCLCQECINEITAGIGANMSNSIKETYSPIAKINVAMKALVDYLVDYTYNNRSIIVSLRNPENSALLYMIDEAAIKFMTNIYNDVSNELNVPYEKEIFIPFIVGGLSKSIYIWLEKNKDGNIDKIKHDIYASLDLLLSAAVK